MIGRFDQGRILTVLDLEVGQQVAVVNAKKV